MQNQVSFEELSKVNIQQAELIDVCSYQFDYSLTQEQRIIHLVKHLKNPYCFRVGDIGVKLEFSENASTLQEVFTDLLIRKKSGL